MLSRPREGGRSRYLAGTPAPARRGRRPGNRPDRGVTDDLSEFLAQTALTRPDEPLREHAAPFAGAGSPAEAAGQACSWVNEHLTYIPGSTHVHTSAAEAFSSGSGVCQDFSHLAIGLLCELGIPARYVSGHLHPQADAEIGAAVAGESHAWVEYLVGHWRSWDPTNARRPGPVHVLTGRGRDYSDVPPLRGLYAGGQDSGSHAEVVVTRLR